MVTSGLILSVQVDSVGLYCPMGCAGSHTSLNMPEERILIVIKDENVYLIIKVLSNNNLLRE